MTTKYKNQTDIFDPLQNNHSILIVGIGGVGSMVAYNLSKMGCQNITICDYDDVEEHNVASQFYGAKDIGQPKTKTLADNVQLLTSCELQIHNEPFKDEFTFGHDVVIVCVDNMDIRKQVVDSALADNVPVIFETRMTGTSFIINTITNDEEALIRQGTWFPEKEVEPVPCTTKATAFNCSVIGGYVGMLYARRCKLGDIKPSILVDLEKV